MGGKGMGREGLIQSLHSRTDNAPATQAALHEYYTCVTGAFQDTSALQSFVVRAVLMADAL